MASPAPKRATKKRTARPPAPKAVLAEPIVPDRPRTKTGATVGEGHEAHWPDKLVFAALLLMVAGGLGILYGLLVSTGATLGPKLPSFLRDYPVWAILTGSAIALVSGWTSFRFQWSLAGWVGVVAACASMGFLGLVPVMAVFAAGMLVMSRIEGEATRFSDRVSAEHWPDKAIMASLFLVVGGIFTAAQAATQYLGVFDAILLKDMPWIWATFSVVAALAMLLGGFLCFRLRGGPLPLVGAALGIAALAFYIVGPILGFLALIFIGFAYRENEFTA